jgi:hypothetical protein
MAQTLSGFTSLNPASIAWENVPYSFVVDWFVDIGGYMRAAETAMLFRSRFIRGYVTQTQYVSMNERVNSSKRGANDFVQCNMYASGVVVTVSRLLLMEFPFPRRPSFKADLGSGRLLNAAALLAQHLGK